MKCAVISHENCFLHEMGAGHPESPARLTVIMDALRGADYAESLSFHHANPASFNQIHLAHDEEYVDAIIQSSPEYGWVWVDSDTAMNPFTLDAAKHAVGAVIDAVNLVMQHDFARAFCAIRPPGHHAERNKAMGFCFFNNIAIGALYALAEYDIDRVAIVDFDVHHGNGTEDIVKENNHILFCSSFQHALFPFTIDHTLGHNIVNLPMEEGISGIHFRKAITDNVLPELRAFEPDLILISAGFDAHQADPLANINLNEDDFYWVTQKIVECAKEFAMGRVVSTLEGGYNLDVLGSSVNAHVKALLEL